MARLPQPGQDVGVWGDILNDYLRTEHSANGLHNVRAILDVPQAEGMILVSHTGAAKGVAWRIIDTDGMLAANSDDRIASQRAVREFVDAKFTLAASTRTTRFVVGPDSAGYIVDGNNDHIQIQQAIDDAHASWLADGIVSEVFLRNYVYDCRQIQIKSGVRLVGESPQGVVLSYPNTYSASAIINQHYAVNGAAGNNVMDEHFSIRSLTIRHEGSSKTSGGGIILQGVRHFTISEVEFWGCPRFNMLVTGRYGDTLSGTCNVTNGSDNLSGVGTAFLTEIAAGDIVRIQRSEGTDRFVRIYKVLSNTLAKLDGVYGQETMTGRALFRVEPNVGMVLERLKFTGTYEATEAWDNSGFGFCDYGIVKDCESFGAQGYGFGPDHSQGIQFINCYAHDNANAGIGAETCAYAQITGGSFNKNGVGLRLLSGTHSTTVLGAHCLYNATSGISIERNSTVFPTARDNQFVNIISAFNEQHGMRIGGANGTKVSGGKWYNNGISGITLAVGNSNNPANTSIENADCFDNRPTRTQDYGIFIMQATNTRLNNVRALDAENEVAGINNAGTGTMVLQAQGTDLRFNGKLTNVVNPTVAQDVATKAYVDSAIAAALG